MAGSLSTGRRWGRIGMRFRMPFLIGILAVSVAGLGALFGAIAPQRAGIAAHASTLASKGDKAFGEYLSATCTTCHQVTGRATGGVPPILAWPEDQFAAVMKSYRAKDRDNQVMQTIASRLTDEEIYALAAYFGGLPLQPDIK